jgi:hypothetical protein
LTASVDVALTSPAVTPPMRPALAMPAPRLSMPPWVTSRPLTTAPPPTDREPALTWPLASTPATLVSVRPLPGLPNDTTSLRPPSLLWAPMATEFCPRASLSAPRAMEPRPLANALRPIASAPSALAKLA